MGIIPHNDTLNNAPIQLFYNSDSVIFGACLSTRATIGATGASILEKERW